ncbi:MAG TPA: hypothetical protein VG754_03805 [Verrucomicrobiae bacterium]|nr:hypothetical protein [Verrucomicrobiae bacterium]
MEKDALITAGLAALTFAAFASWFLMARRPQQWAAWVERENDFWRDKGLISARLTEKLKRWEKGKSLKILAGVTGFIGIVGLCLTLSVWVKVIFLRHQKLRGPYNPALHLKLPPPGPKS